MDIQGDRIVFRPASRLHRIVVGLSVLLIVAGCGRQRTDEKSVSSRTLWVMGTQASVTLPAPDAARIDEAADIVEAVFVDIERKLSLYRAASELTAINKAAGKKPVTVSPVTLNTVRLAYQYAQSTHGLFDPTVTPLLQRWHEAATRRSGIPDASDLAKALSLVDYRRIVIDAEASTVFLQRSGMVLDLGGIAKGKAADLAAATLKAKGYDAFLIDLGGDIRCAGAPADQPAWRVGVRNPFDTSQLLGVLHMQEFPAVTTSGNYERFIEINGKRFGHIIDPRNGKMAQDMAGVTVTAEDAAKADALSTALFVAGLEKAPEIIAHASPLEALLVPDRLPMEIWLTEGFKSAFEPNPEYRNAIRTLPGTPVFDQDMTTTGTCNHRSDPIKARMTSALLPLFSVDNNGRKEL